MKGLFLDSSEKPKFLYQKFGGKDPGLVAAAIEALVESQGFDIVFGIIFRWKVDEAALRVIKEDAEKILQENGFDLDFETKEKAKVYGTLRVVMCHEMYAFGGNADSDVEEYGLQYEMEHMVGLGRMHEDDLATLISSSGCVVTTRSGLMNAMHGMKSRRVDTGHSHELVIFYDDEGISDSDDSENDMPNIDLSDLDLDL